MHSAVLSIASFALSEGAAWEGPPPGSSLRHADCAPWKAGDRGLIPEPGVMLIPPPGLGSGKLGIPCERMQSANFRPSEDPAASLGRPAAPQAATAAVQLRTARADER